MYPHSAPQVASKGAATRFGDLSRQNCGPLAVLNAVEPAVAGYEERRPNVTWTSRKVSSRLPSAPGRDVAHAAYLEN